MFRTKSEVDRHVGRILMRAKNTSQRNKESFQIANLYFEVKDYEQANSYLANYLSEFSLDPHAWKLKANLCEVSMSNDQVETSKNMTMAIEYYTKSFTLNNQSDLNLLLKICSCYLKTDENFDVNRAKEWLSSAEKHFPYDKTVIDLKEKLHSLFDKVNGKNQDELNNWEVFLTKAINENLLNEELHVKLIKIHLKKKNYLKAVRHLLKVEQKSIFVADSSHSNAENYYTSCIGLIESALNEFEITKMNYDYVESETNDYNLKLLYLTISILINRYLLNSLLLNSSQNDLKQTLEFYMKFNKCLVEYEKINLTNLKFPNLANELMSEFYFLAGLLMLKYEEHAIKSAKAGAKLDFLQEEVNEFEAIFISSTDCAETNSKLSDEKLTALFCFIKSNAVSHPNHSLDQTEPSRPNECETLIHELIRLIQRNCFWKYSIVGNWCRFVINTFYSCDRIEFLKQIKHFCHNFDVKSKIKESIFFVGLQDSESVYLNQLNEASFKLDTVKPNFIDPIVLEFSDKYCFENQTLNLKYLIWHCLVNTKIDPKSNDLNEVPPYFKQQMKKQDIKFGVENLNICSLESVCLLDMKIFLYSCIFQAISYLKSQSSESAKSFFIKPFWLQENLCSEAQSNWWFYCTNYLFRSKQQKSPNQQIKLSTAQTSLKFFEENSQLTLNLDVKKQNELAKILELIRLKSSRVSIANTEFRFKFNLKILIALTNYLQYLYNNEQEIFSNNNQNNEFLLYSPKQKLYFLKLYLAKYWQFLTKHLVKLKQMVSMSENADETSFDSDQINIDFIDLSNLNDSLNAQFNKSKQQTLSLFDEYFKHYSSVNSFFEETSKLMANVNVRDSSRRLSCLVNQQKHESVDYNDLVIKNGILNLILLNVKSLSKGASLEDDEREEAKWLSDSISLFDLMDKSLNEKTKHELNSSQLKLCKQIGEVLIEIRDQTELSKQTASNAEMPSLCAKLEKVYILIEFLKKNINTVFRSKSKCLNEAEKNQLSTLELNIIDSLANRSSQSGDELLIGNTSITEQIKQVNQIIKESEIDQGKQRIRELEEQAENERIMREQQQQQQQVKLQQAAENEAKLKKVEERKRVELEAEKLRAQEEEAQRKKLARESKQEQANLEQNKKMQNLIEILTKQRSKHLELNMDTMKDQFDLIRAQNKQIKNEIGHLSQRNQRRKNSLNEFNQVVRIFNELCDMKSFNAQFNVFYWLFQQNPNLSEYFLLQGQGLENKMLQSHQPTATINSHDQGNLSRKSNQSEREATIQEKTITTPKTIQQQPVKSATFSAPLNEYQTPETNKSSKTSMNKSSTNIESYYLTKALDDIKFPTGIDFIGKLKDSAIKFKVDRDRKFVINQGEESGQENEEERQYLDQPDDYYGENYVENYENEAAAHCCLDPISQHNYNNLKPYLNTSQQDNNASQTNASVFGMTSLDQSRQDTFLSCEENNFSQCRPQNELSKSSIADLYVLFDSHSCLLYGSDFSAENQWSLIGESSVQIIADEVSQKGQFNAYVICTLQQDKKTFQYDINPYLIVKHFKNASNSVYWYDGRRNKPSNLGAVRFENETQLKEFERNLALCMTKMAASLKNDSAEINTSWMPNDMLTLE